MRKNSETSLNVFRHFRSKRAYMFLDAAFERSGILSISDYNGIRKLSTPLTIKKFYRTLQTPLKSL